MFSEIIIENSTCKEFYLFNQIIGLQNIKYLMSRPGNQ